MQFGDILDLNKDELGEHKCLKFSKSSSMEFNVNLLAPLYSECQCVLACVVDLIYAEN